MPPTPDPRPDVAPERPVPDSGPDDPIDYDAAERAFEKWRPGRSGSSLRSFNAGARWGHAVARDARVTPTRGDDAAPEDVDPAFKVWWSRRGDARWGSVRLIALDAFRAGAEWAAARGVENLSRVFDLGEDTSLEAEQARYDAEDAPQAHQDARRAVAGPSEHSEGLHGADGDVEG